MLKIIKFYLHPNISFSVWVDGDSACNATVTKAGKRKRKLVGPDDKVIMVKWANCYPDDFEGEAARFFGVS